ncbi:hypothetical protein, conserved [Plasmodium gonderi]|uniref:Uncharacterized protein n=1 Tax=Plasmodium gonderi TaxID=77519 RepID=A0A1Y1JAE1_PLAGO|nr:hypothetical protein, conserved [Plasmodium gonderi]GAW79481.1 hypothetical protein, conserved [Plasmodium gonderi]
MNTDISSKQNGLEMYKRHVSNDNEDAVCTQNIQNIHLVESCSHFPNSTLLFVPAQAKLMTDSTTMPPNGNTDEHVQNFPYEDSSQGCKKSCIRETLHMNGNYIRLGSSNEGKHMMSSNRREPQERGANIIGGNQIGDNQIGDNQIGGNQIGHNPIGHNPRRNQRGGAAYSKKAESQHLGKSKKCSNVSSRGEKKRHRNLFMTLRKTISLLCNEILAKSFQTMISYVITTSFFIFLNLYVSNSCTYEEIGGFGMAASVITLLTSVVDGVSNSLDYFCSFATGIGNTDLSLLFLNIAYNTFYIFYLKMIIIFFFSKCCFFLFLNYAYTGDGVNMNKNNEHIYMINVFFSTLQILLISFFPQFIYESTRRYLILHNYIYPSLYTSFVSFILLNFFCYIFVFYMGMKYVGASLSLLLTNVFNLFSILKFLNVHLGRCLSLEGQEVHRGGVPSQTDETDEVVTVFPTWDKQTNGECEVSVPCFDHYMEMHDDPRAYSPEDVLEDVCTDSPFIHHKCSHHENRRKEDASNSDSQSSRNDSGNHFGNSWEREIETQQMHMTDRSIYNLQFLFFHKPPDDTRKKDFVKTTRTNIKNIFFEILSFEFQLFESTYLSLTSVATFVQINNILNLVYYVSNSYGIVLSKLIGVYITSQMEKKGRQKLRKKSNVMNAPRKCTKRGKLGKYGKETISNMTSLPNSMSLPNLTIPLVLSNPSTDQREEVVMFEVESRMRIKKNNITLLEIFLAFFMLLSFLYLCLGGVYIYRDKIIPLVFSDINIQRNLREIFFIFTVELFFEILASLLNSVVKGLSLQEEISAFTFFNFLFFMHPLGFILTFFIKLDIYGFVYSNLISMTVQVIYLIVFLTIRLHKMFLNGW